MEFTFRKVLRLEEIAEAAHRVLREDRRHEYPTLLIMHPKDCIEFLASGMFPNVNLYEPSSGISIVVGGAKLNIHRSLDIKEKTFIVK